jgi:LacI family transcriptional regulator
VSIVSINDISLAKFVTPPLTTFHINMEALVSNAMKLLVEQIIENRTYRKKLFIESDLVVRKTT